LTLGAGCPPGRGPSGGARLINARARRAADKPSSPPRWRPALLLPAEGWYELRRGGGAKQPFFITGRTEAAPGSSLAMAGIWEFWRSPAGGEPLVTAAVLDHRRSRAAGRHPPRMPLLLAAEDWAAWLDPDGGPRRRCCGRRPRRWSPVGAAAGVGHGEQRAAMRGRSWWPGPTRPSRCFPWTLPNRLSPPSHLSPPTGPPRWSPRWSPAVAGRVGEAPSKVDTRRTAWPGSRCTAPLRAEPACCSGTAPAAE